MLDPGRALVDYLCDKFELDTEDPHLVGTPERFTRMWGDLLSGYGMDYREILSTDFDENYDEIVVLKGVWFSSVCSHHLLPFIGQAYVGYIPGEASKVVGVSKLVRLVECFSRRLQVQERLAKQIAGALEEVLKPAAVGVLLEAQHMCMACRGVRKSSTMSTSVMLGRFRERWRARDEFLRLIGK